jgi:hypothetical protein
VRFEVPLPLDISLPLRWVPDMLASVQLLCQSGSNEPARVSDQTTS